MVDFLSCLSRATLDPALGGRGLALSRLLSLATFAAARGDDEAQATLADLTGTMSKVLNDNRDLRHEEWNDLQASAEAGHWFLRTTFPQRGRDGGIVGGHTSPAEAPGAAIGSPALTPVSSGQTPHSAPSPQLAGASSPPAASPPPAGRA
jgi:hypothetical protein